MCFLLLTIGKYYMIMFDIEEIQGVLNSHLDKMIRLLRQLKDGDDGYRFKNDFYNDFKKHQKRYEEVLQIEKMLIEHEKSAIGR